MRHDEDIAWRGRPHFPRRELTPAERRKLRARIRKMDRDHAKGGRFSGLYDCEYVWLRRDIENQLGKDVPGMVTLPVTGPKLAIGDRAHQIALH